MSERWEVRERERQRDREKGRGGKEGAREGVGEYKKRVSREKVGDSSISTAYLCTGNELCRTMNSFNTSLVGGILPVVQHIITFLLHTATGMHSIVSEWV